MPRLDQILKLLEKSPADAFLLYAAALEHKKLGDFRTAIAYLDQALGIDAKFCYAYYQKGQCFESLDDNASAARAYRQGIKVAQSIGDAKAEGELAGALAIVE
jgi:tetratricopeptide (TPR) repeat protein